MIPFIRSLDELMVITKSREQIYKKYEKQGLNNLSVDSAQTKKYIRSKEGATIDLPDLPNTKRRKWSKSKAAISKFFDNFDYNNQIQSSYDLTLLESQKNYDTHNAA